MIDPQKHKYHLDILGCEEEFNQLIDYFHEIAPWLSDEEIEAILDDEVGQKISPAFWYLN